MSLDSLAAVGPRPARGVDVAPRPRRRRLPGLPLAAALPAGRVLLVDSIGKKVALPADRDRGHRARADGRGRGRPRRGAGHRSSATGRRGRPCPRARSPRWPSWSSWASRCSRRAGSSLPGSAAAGRGARGRWTSARRPAGGRLEVVDPAVPGLGPIGSSSSDAAGPIDPALPPGPRRRRQRPLCRAPGHLRRGRCVRSTGARRRPVGHPCQRRGPRRGAR